MQITKEFYKNELAEFHRRFGEEIETYVKAEYLDNLAQCERILVVGCGSGKEVEYLSARNKRASVIGVDFMVEPILYARAKYPSLKEQFVVGDYYSLGELFEGQFDAIVANAAFVHLLERKDLQERIMPAISQRLRPGGLAFLRLLDRPAVLERQQFDITPEFQGRPRWFVYYSEEELCEIALQIRLSVVKRKTHPHDRFPGTSWSCVLLEKTIAAS